METFRTEVVPVDEDSLAKDKTFGPKFEQTTRRLRKQDEVLALDECCKGMTAK